MPDAISATDINLDVSFAPGDIVLVRKEPLLKPMVVDHITPSGWLACASMMNRRYRQWELVACPPGHEPAPSSEELCPVEDDPLWDLWRTLFWARRNWTQLVSLHGDLRMAETMRHVRESIRLQIQIRAALAEEPGASAMRQAEIAMGEVAR